MFHSAHLYFINLLNRLLYYFYETFCEISLLFTTLFSGIEWEEVLTLILFVKHVVIL